MTTLNDALTTKDLVQFSECIDKRTLYNFASGYLDMNEHDIDSCLARTTYPISEIINRTLTRWRVSSHPPYSSNELLRILQHAKEDGLQIPEKCMDVLNNEATLTNRCITVLGSRLSEDVWTKLAEEYLEIDLDSLRNSLPHSISENLQTSVYMLLNEWAFNRGGPEKTKRDLQTAVKKAVNDRILIVPTLNQLNTILGM